MPLPRLGFVTAGHRTIRFLFLFYTCLFFHATGDMYRHLPFAICRFCVQFRALFAYKGFNVLIILYSPITTSCLYIIGIFCEKLIARHLVYEIVIRIVQQFRILPFLKATGDMYRHMPKMSSGSYSVLVSFYSCLFRKSTTLYDNYIFNCF
jgi:hypothetical protein